ncbi:hypothetical protein AAG906_012804 [Vitis piasezkii]
MLSANPVVSCLMAVTESCQFEEHSFGVCVVDVATRRIILGQSVYRCFNDLSVSGSLNEANLSVKDSFVEEDPLGLPDILSKLVNAGDFTCCSNSSCIEFTGRRLPGRYGFIDERTRQTIPEAAPDGLVVLGTPIASPVDGDMYTDISTENAMLQGSRRLSKGVEYLVEASTAEAEAINATLATAKARQVNGEVELPDQDTLNLNGPPFNTHEVQTDTTDKSVSVRNISNDSLVVSDGKMTTDENSELNLLTSSSNLASISLKLRNTSQRNHFPNQRSGYFLCTRVSSDSVHQLQKQRIQQARAIHSDSDVYFIDDPFGVVDAHAAAFLLYECVMAAFAHKIVILVTHQVESLSEVDKILAVEAG